VAVKACLNGGRSRAEHPAIPLSAAELAADALAVRGAGAFAVHVHPRNRDGEQTLDAAACDGAVGAIRAAVPSIGVGLSTAEAIDRDPFARAAAISRWRQRPDFVSVNVSESGWAGIVRSALHADVAVEAGLSTPEEAEAFARSPFTHQVLRALVEVEDGAACATAVSELIPAGIPQVWHGFDESTWEVIEAAARRGFDVRIGLEDVLTLPDGSVAANNAELVAAAVELVAASR
jgi:uncharacterized protein (DUF849 family)